MERSPSREKQLRESNQRISQSLNLQEIFDTACIEIRRFTKADRVTVFKFSPESKCQEGKFIAESVVEKFDSVIAKRIQDHCFGDNHAQYYLQGRCFICDDIYNNDLPTCHIDLLAQFQIKANLVIPLIFSETLWGLLCVHQCSAPRHWEEGEVELTQQLANQVMIAMRQADLFEQLQQQLSEREKDQKLLIKRNEQLALSNLELARSTRLKDEFLANMSHELRTPLNAILGMTEALQDEIFGAILKEQLQPLKTIEESGNHLLELINDILDLAKVEAGMLELKYGSTDVRALCHSSLTFVKQMAAHKNIDLQEKLPFQIPNMVMDELRIRQMLINLLNNAVKFTPNGGHVTLEVTAPPLPADALAMADTARLQFAIHDTGIGIEPEQIQQLFKPFTQVDSALNRKYNGTGLGLALVKRIAELHGGEVSVTSQVGIGSCFTVSLPYDVATSVVASLQLAGASDPNEVGTSEPEQTDAPFVLLAEDNEANVAVIDSYLKARGYRIAVAQDGQQAVSMAQAKTPDLILMDIQMPKMDGFKAIESLRQDARFKDLPIIALTALAMKGDRERCLAAGANDYLSKPIKLKQLVATIQQLLDT
jgi:signal transduction histidine kinase/ActR/RegA family two-component response regulator